MSILYMCTIYPLELIYKHIYLACVSVVDSYGVGLMVMSLVTFVIFVPLKKWAKKAAGKERDIQDVLAPQIAKIQSESTGAERQERISKLYKRYGYHPVMAIRSAIGAGLQIPFLMAAYYMISGLKGLEGQSFLFVKNLSRPDGLLFGLNLLPIVMTLINFATTFTTKDMRKKDRIQAIIIALLFLALLYSAPSALLIYWTCNNILYLAENIKPVKNGMDKMFALVRRAFAKGWTVLKRISLTLKQKDISLACLFGLSCGLFFFMFIPMNSYWHNVNEFDFKAVRLARFLVPYVLICSLITGGIAFWTSKNKKISANGVSAFHVFVLSVMIAFLVEGTLMGYGLRQLNGEENLFASKGRMVWDSLVWFGIVGGFMCFRRNIARNFVNVLAVFAFICSATFADTYIHRKEKARADTLKATEYLVTTTKDDILSKLQYSNNDNILIIIPDSLDSLSLEKTLDLNPALKKTFNDFYWFQENLAAGGFTELAIPQILSGKTFTGKSYRDFVQNALFGEESLPMQAVKRGRKMYVEAYIWNLLGDGASASVSQPQKKKITLSLKDKVSFAFRFVPYVAKGKLESVVNFSSGFGKEDPNKTVIDAMMNRMEFRTDAPVTQFIHMMGAHPPYKDRIKHVEKWIVRFDGYLKALKVNGLYDKSTIIVIADHGDHSDQRQLYPERKAPYGTFHFPAFLIKMPNMKTDLTIKKDLMSTVYLNDLLNTFYTKGQTRAVLDEYLTTLPSTRPIFMSAPIDAKCQATGTYATLSVKVEDNSMAYKDLKPLKKDILYTFVQNSYWTTAPYPDWIGKNLARFGGDVANFITDKAELSLKTEIKNKQKKWFTFEIITYDKNEVKIKITDKNSKYSNVFSGGTDPDAGVRGKHLYVNIEATADENGMVNFSFEKLSSFAGGIAFVRYRDKKTEPFKTGKVYNLTRTNEMFQAFYSGWQVPEIGGIWTAAREAKARFKLASRPKRDVNVAMTFSFMPYPNANNYLRIVLPNRKIVYEQKFPDEARTETVEFIYPLNLVKKDNTIHLTIESNLHRHNVINPKVNDARTIGAYLKAFKFNEDRK